MVGVAGSNPATRTKIGSFSFLFLCYNQVMSLNVVFLYFKWHYIDRTRIILKGWKNVLAFNLSYFSIPFLLKTLFSPWKKYKWSYGRGFDPGRILQTSFSNLISRIIGAFIRIIFIIIGIIFEIFFFFAGILFFIVWIFLPFILVYLFFFGLKLIF